MISKHPFLCHVALVAATLLLLLSSPLGAQEAPTHPDLMDPVGRYQLQLPAHWQVVGTNSKLNGFVIGNGEDSFATVYHDGKVSTDETLRTMAALCSCSIPEKAKIEVLSNAKYPAQLIEIGKDDRGSVVVGTVVFPGGMFGLVSSFKNEKTRLAMKEVLRQARPGPARPK